MNWIFALQSMVCLILAATLTGLGYKGAIPVSDDYILGALVFTAVITFLVWLHPCPGAHSGQECLIVTLWNSMVAKIKGAFSRSGAFTEPINAGTQNGNYSHSGSGPNLISHLPTGIMSSVQTNPSLSPENADLTAQEENLSSLFKALPSEKASTPNERSMPPSYRTNPPSMNNLNKKLELKRCPCPAESLGLVNTQCIIIVALVILGAVAIGVYSYKPELFIRY